MAYKILIVNDVVQTQPLAASERFVGVAGGPLASSTVGDYWQWGSSDIVGNTERGALAEFIVAKAIGCPAQTRNDWTAYDLVSPSGIKVEVKSSAYLQSWHQKRPSRPRFSIRKSLEWAPKTNEYVGQSRRHSDVYVFCLLSFRGDKHFLNPLDLTQWEFYVVRTADIDELFGDRQGISLREVQQLSQPYAVEEFPNAIESAATTP
jgi:hypothetical protein|tara:strand:- start:160 stop:777 length:618 start_codon:yes stop_codon:yes gene_type:complete